MSEQTIAIKVKVNTETGQLEVMGSKMAQTAQKTKELAGEAKNLAASFLPFATAAGIIKFFADAVRGAEEEAEALRTLKFTLEATGQSWEANKASIDEWAGAIQSVTRFSDTVALQSLDKLARSTKTVGQAQAAATLAMNLSVASGKPLAETTGLVNDLINKQERALVKAQKEFGNFTGGAQTTQEALDNLSRATADAALTEDSLTKSLNLGKNAFGEFSDQIGRTLTPAVATITEGLVFLLKIVDNLGAAIAGQAAIIFHSFIGVSRAIKAVLTGDFSSLESIASETMAAVKSDFQATGAEIAAEWAVNEQRKTDIVRQNSQERIDVTTRETDAERADRAKAAQEAEEQGRKVLEMEAQLDQQLAQLGDQTFQKKKQALESELAARRSKINSEIKLESDKAKLLDKINAYEKAAKVALAQEEIFIKQELALSIIGTSVQTLQVLNSLGEKGSGSEKARAKALLALQQAVTIGWIWVGAAKSAGAAGLLASPGIAALAAVQTGLAIAQFAQQSRAIDQAANREQSDIGAISIAPNVPGIDIGAPAGGGVSFPGSGVGSSGGGGGGGGGSGGGQVVIHMGGQVFNIIAKSIDRESVRELCLQIGEEARRGGLEGTTMALSIVNAAESKSGLGV